MVRRHLANCSSPFLVRDPDTNQNIPVRCNKCANCVSTRISGWTFRLIQEDKNSLSAHFVTLTYNNEHLPRTANGFKTLNKKHVQDFMKRLRYYSPKVPKIKYYAAGEYGTNTKRPHYHIILFNATPDNVELAWRDKNGSPLGTCYFGTVASASVGYTLKYISKKAFKKVHSRDDRIPEFALMSQGLGKSYLTDAMRQWHEEDMYNRMYLHFEGKKLSMPRYYKDKLYTKEQRQHIGSYLAGKMQDELSKKMDQYGPNYYRDKAQADKAANDRMLYRTNKTDKL